MTFYQEIHQLKHPGAVSLAAVLIAFAFLSIMAAVSFSMHGKTLKTEIRHREHLTSYRRELLARSIANAAAESIYDGADYGDLSAGAAASAPVKITGGGAALYAKISMQKFDSVYVIRAQVSEAEDFANGATTSVTAKVPLTLSAEEKRLIWSTVN